MESTFFAEIVQTLASFHQTQHQALPSSSPSSHRGSACTPEPDPTSMPAKGGCWLCNTDGIIDCVLQFVTQLPKGMEEWVHCQNLVLVVELLEDQVEKLPGAD